MANLVQKQAPQFTAKAVVDGQFKDVSLSEYKGKFVVLLFYPMDFTFVCPTEILAFSDAHDEFKSRNAEVLAISTDTEYSHFAWTQQPRAQGGLSGLKLPMIADVTKKISADYNVLVPEAGLALRGLFIIDPKGIVRISQVNDWPIGRSSTETLRLIDAIAFTDKHGEVCPANWTKDSNKATIKPDPKGSLEYFSKH